MLRGCRRVAPQRLRRPRKPWSQAIVRSTTRWKMPRTAVWLASLRDHWADVSLPEQAAVPVVVVAAVGQQRVGASTGSADPSRDAGILSSSGLSWVTSPTFSAGQRYREPDARDEAEFLGEVLPLDACAGRRGSRTGPGGPAPVVCPWPSSDPVSAATARSANTVHPTRSDQNPVRVIQEEEPLRLGVRRCPVVRRLLRGLLILQKLDGPGHVRDVEHEHGCGQTRFACRPGHGGRWSPIDAQQTWF